MIRLLTFPIRLITFWLLFFALFRLWFIVWFNKEWSVDAPHSVWVAFWRALPLDLSTAGYLIAIPVVIWFWGWGLTGGGKKRCDHFIFWYNVCLTAALVFPFGANVFLYEEWHTLLNNRALEYMKDPSALLDSMSVGFIVASVLLYLGFVWIMVRSYRWIVGRYTYPSETPKRGLFAAGAWLLVIPLAIRGGLGVMPINESAVYYSPHLFNNHAATNTFWHLVHSLVETRSTKNHYISTPVELATQDLARLLPPFDSTVRQGMRFFQTPDSARLNLVFIIMESMTAQVIEELGGEPGVCPNLSRLIREGILFTNCYSSGYRTDQGLVSVLAGYPAQPDQSIVLLEDKASKLSSISSVLKKKQYATAFFYGGELTFANIGAWLSQQRFERTWSEADFKSEEITQRWGVDDRNLLQRAVQEIGLMQQPFFVTAMTLSLHPPFDVPFQSKWQGNTEKEKFLHSAAFADAAVGDFFQSASQQPWYDRTLFIIVADHGASPPQGVGLDNPVSRHIPWIIFGKPLGPQWQGFKSGLFCNHHDIPSTVLEMMNLHEPSAFPWSRNLWQWHSDSLNFKGFAYFSNENGMGWLDEKSKSVYFFEKKQWHNWQGRIDSIGRRESQSYLQMLYDDFLNK
ncbi:MAG: sulfatase-like hydrolase/transferase [Saprospiraceae bacterium]|nr:sulfatase-like hydrolase/transferase [Saprospiraceae bacterium]